MTASSRFTDRGRVFVTTWVLGSLFVAILLGSSPQLHARVHSDAARPDHTCAVTLIASGSFDHATPPPIVLSTAHVQFSKVRDLYSIWVQPLFLKAHIFAHAPPFAA
jgi:hypothetical protein